jgi:predicted permease
VTQDLRYGLRLIAKSRGFTAVAVLSLGIGIGAATILFSFANAFLFRPLYADQGHDLVEVFTSSARGSLYNGNSWLDYQDYAAQAGVFSGLAAFDGARASFSDSDRPDMVQGMIVSGNYFEVLGLKPALGRFFLPGEADAAASQPVVVLGHDMWARRFNADPAILGRAVGLNGHASTVIGVAPPGFGGTSFDYSASFFVPATMEALMRPDERFVPSRGGRIFSLLGRLKPGMSISQAQAALDLLAAQLHRAYPEDWKSADGRGRRITVLPELEARHATAGLGMVRWLFLSVMAGVLTLLGIACVNVATVLMARASTRRKEIAVRLALGASRGRIVRQLLTECALLAVAGGALGVWIAHSGGRLFERFRMDGMPPFDLTLDVRILVFAIGASALTVILFGLAPALQTTKIGVNAELKGMAPALRVRRLRIGLRDGLVVTQVAVSLVLTVVAGLLLRSVYESRTADPGFRRDDIVNIGVDLSTLPGGPDAHAAFYREAVDAVKALPGVDGVALAGLVPLSGSNMQYEFLLGAGDDATRILPYVNVVGPGYFRMLDIAVRSGREFTGADVNGGPPVALVNDVMAQRYWQGAALGKTLRVEETGETVDVVGVVRGVADMDFNGEVRPMVFLCAGQRYRARMTLHVRSEAPASAIGPALERALHEINRTAALTPARTMHDHIAFATLGQRIGGAGAAATGVLELSLAIMALYGVIAYSAAQRMREIGLRMALGAPAASVTRLVMHHGLVLSAVGVAIGGVVAIAMGPALQSLLIGVSPLDPATLVLSMLLMIGAGTAASYLPARRAMRVDPMTALRAE